MLRLLPALRGKAASPRETSLDAERASGQSAVPSRQDSGRVGRDSERCRLAQQLRHASGGIIRYRTESNVVLVPSLAVGWKRKAHQKVRARVSDFPALRSISFLRCRNSVKMSSFELFRNVLFWRGARPGVRPPTGPRSLRRSPRALRALLGPAAALPHWRPHSWPANALLQPKWDILS